MARRVYLALRMVVAFIAVLVAGFVIQLPAETDPCLDRMIPINV